MEYKKLPKKDEKLLFGDSSPAGIAEFVKKHYKVTVMKYDRETRIITPLDSKRANIWLNDPPDDTLRAILLHAKIEGLRISRSDLLEVFDYPEFFKSFDPVVGYFDSIRGTYKGVSHIDILGECLAARPFSDNTPEHYQQRAANLLKKWLVACVACWLGNIPNDVALVLISGKGGIGKTSFGNFLVPEKLKEYYVSISKNNNKPFNMKDAFARCLFINAEEMIGLNNYNINEFKMLMSQREIEVKEAYRNFTSKKPRRGCFMASTNHNQENYGFIDPEWGDTRRFGCIEITGIDYNRYEAEVDINQVWAEALNLYEGTVFKYIFDMETDFPQFNEYNNRFLRRSSAHYYVETYFEVPDDDNDGIPMNASMVFQHLMDNKLIRGEHEGPGRNKVNYDTIGRALSSMGFPKTSFKPEGKKVYNTGYLVKVKSKRDSNKQQKNNHSANLRIDQTK
ncbi:MAG: virulence-associated E family protein [Prevotella sp.]|jgi:predicted P-loop ATPase|nr:virulence-associated E family protein [Prevotella sp.]